MGGEGGGGERKKPLVKMSLRLVAQLTTNDLKRVRQTHVQASISAGRSFASTCLQTYDGCLRFFSKMMVGMRRSRLSSCLAGSVWGMLSHWFMPDWAGSCALSSVSPSSHGQTTETRFVCWRRKNFECYQLIPVTSKWKRTLSFGMDNKQ